MKDGDVIKVGSVKGVVVNIGGKSETRVRNINQTGPQYVEDLSAAIQSELDITKEERTEATEMVNDLRTEAGKPKPSRSRVKGMIHGLKEWAKDTLSDPSKIEEYKELIESVESGRG